MQQIENGTQAFLFLIFEISNWCQSTQNQILNWKIKIIFIKNRVVVPRKAAKPENLG